MWPSSACRSVLGAVEGELERRVSGSGGGPSGFEAVERAMRAVGGAAPSSEGQPGGGGGAIGGGLREDRDAQNRPRLQLLRRPSHTRSLRQIFGRSAGTKIFRTVRDRVLRMAVRRLQRPILRRSSLRKGAGGASSLAPRKRFPPYKGGEPRFGDVVPGTSSERRSRTPVCVELGAKMRSAMSFPRRAAQQYPGNDVRGGCEAEKPEGCERHSSGGGNSRSAGSSSPGSRSWVSGLHSGPSR